ncbi:hypothetical protein THTE_0552 [Thermogutta terrifontis]|uniref:Uncharacterized protein n=1 Tax=Thermogutta terrifontis TaxID=1331910 RepID=A0A286RB16_9BACT|nr:hypothetical protein THTE_0552 [Thermogutta terrifontis]
MFSPPRGNPKQIPVGAIEEFPLRRIEALNFRSPQEPFPEGPACRVQ